MATMTVIHLEAVPPALRGTLTRWMTEPVTGLFTGNMSARVRDEVWRMITRSRDTGRAVLVHTADNEQGYLIRTAGDSARRVIDIDGLQLIAIQ
ncbi:MAG: type I-E CRISPR-associated endoribonuclease Cas2 [Microthrixaceae bacterium]|nr:type I-E CRISPR-associated endoribonuclease Cas2 [Microthrixaceae bacterium]